jgi:hypothetical protein
MSGGNGSTAPTIAAPDFAALYRELGVDAHCSPAELRVAWRRRVSKLHPDLGGSAEDTGRLQELNRLYDAAVEFHGRFGRMPGAASTAPAAATGGGDAPEAQVAGPAAAAWRRLDAEAEPQAAAGFGRISRWFVVVSLCTMAVLGWRLANDMTGEATGETGVGGEAVATSVVADDTPRHEATTARTVGRTLAPGMDRNAVRDILGDPLDMHAMRWHYGPSWVDFRCDRVADWYSSPLRPLPVASERAPPAAADDCL